MDPTDAIARSLLFDVWIEFLWRCTIGGERVANNLPTGIVLDEYSNNFRASYIENSEARMRHRVKSQKSSSVYRLCL